MPAMTSSHTHTEPSTAPGPAGVRAKIAKAAAGRPATGAPPGGMGTAVTGETLAKLKAAATAKYPGTVEHAMKLPDGSYVVHVIQSSGKGEVHVLVSKAFKVTGVQKGGPPGAPSVS
jgi:hypothetical protein